ncbi:Uncharacterized protein DAT39_005675, partial [Clarias magur]
PPQDGLSFLCTVLILTYSVVSVYFSDYTWGLQQSLSAHAHTHKYAPSPKRQINNGKTRTTHNYEVCKREKQLGISWRNGSITSTPPPPLPFKTFGLSRPPSVGVYLERFSKTQLSVAIFQQGERVTSEHIPARRTKLL